MNLNKAMKEHAVSQVLIDQFKDERDALQKEVNDLIDQAVAPHVENYSKAAKAVEASGAINAGVHYQDSACVGEAGYQTSERALRIEVSKQTPPYLRTDRPYSDWGQYRIVVNLERNGPLREKLVDYRNRVNTLHGQLSQVINSVRTVKKLREITHVFDPFLPTTPQGTALMAVPAEALCAVNELKSPKHDQKAA